MAEDLKFQDIAIAPDFGTSDYLVGVRDNGDGSFTDYRYSASQIAAFVLATLTPGNSVYYGYKDTPGVPSATDIEASISLDYVSGDDIVCDWTTVGSDKYLWVAYPSNYTPYTFFHINDDDEASLGPNSTFNIPAVSGGYYVVMSTSTVRISQDTVIFKNEP